MYKYLQSYKKSYIRRMEKNGTTGTGNKVTQPKRAGHAYSVKRFGDAVLAIKETGLLEKEEIQTLMELRTKIAMKYIGM